MKNLATLKSSEIYHEKGIALAGYDTVSFFQASKAIKGVPQYSYEWRDLVWQFSSHENLVLFKESPQQYIPEYGGFCAFGASQGYKAKPKLNSFKMHQNKLYLNFADYVQHRWAEKINEKIQIADHLWGETKATIPIKANRHFIYLKYRWLKLLGTDLFA